MGTNGRHKLRSSFSSSSGPGACAPDAPQPIGLLCDTLCLNLQRSIGGYSQSARADNSHEFEKYMMSSSVMMLVGSVSVKEHPFIVFPPFSQMFSRQV